jgi:hypothetical protein
LRHSPKKALPPPNRFQCRLFDPKRQLIAGRKMSRLCRLATFEPEGFEPKWVRSDKHIAVRRQEHSPLVQLEVLRLFCWGTFGDFDAQIFVTRSLARHFQGYRTMI